MIGSSLTEIPGVGPARVRALLKQFKTVSAIQAAQLEELEATPSISKPVAKTIYDYFHLEPGPAQEES
ncbi:MAG: helix-hairpin-helix domain-containing protein [Hydrogeniiclostridium mannosilyticum]